MMNETVNEMENEELVLYVFDVFYEYQDDYDSCMEYVRVTAEDENHAVEKAMSRQYMPHGPSEVVCRGEA